MRKKIIGIFVCMLMLATILPISSSTLNNKPHSTIQKNTSLREMMPFIGYHPPSEEYTLVRKDVSAKTLLWSGWSWLPSYTNYAPKGLPDFYQKQGQWKSIVDGGNGIAESTAIGDDVQIYPVGQPIYPEDGVVAPGLNCALESIPAGDDREMWMFCCAVSTANIFWWLDSKYDDPDGFPGDGVDDFPLVEDYGAGDDHATNNAPLLIMKMANALNITNTLFLQIDDWIDTIETWSADAGLEDFIEVSFYTVPTFDFIAGEIEHGKNVILIVYFAMDIGGQCVPVANHAVSCAGVNLEEQKIAICDPYWDVDNPGGPSHNDTQFISYDEYDVAIGSPCPNYPEIEWWLPDYWPYYDYSVVYEALVFNTTNQPPATPTITGPAKAKIKVTTAYNFTTADLDNDWVSYYIDWGDQTNSGWIGPYPSEDVINQSHTWAKKGTYTIKAKAKDLRGNESDWGALTVTMPCSYNIPFLSFWERLFERFPNAFPILQRLLGY